MNKTIVLFLAIAGNLLFSCGQRATYYAHQGTTEGTYYKVTYESPKGINYEQDIIQLLHGFNESLSAYLPNSLISRINQNDPTVVVDHYFQQVFNKATEINKASGGVFDITIAPIVNLWGFGFTSTTPEIDPQKIDSLLQYVGMNKIRISNNRVVKDSPGIMLDVNAIAKGYSVDVVADFLAKKGCRNYLVDIGGEIVAKGVNASGNIWRIGIERPNDAAQYGEAFQAVVQLNNKAMATSGNYRRFFEVDGVKYVHSIDIKTGYPVRHSLLSATIVANDCMTADAWATVCMVSGLEKSMELLEQHPEFEAFLIYGDEKGEYRTFVTNGLKNSIAESPM